MEKKPLIVNRRKKELGDYLETFRELNRERRLFEGDIDEVCYREQLKDFCNIHHYDFVDVNRWGEPIVRVVEI